MRFRIPDAALHAFTELSRLKTEDLEKIISFLQGIPIGIGFEGFTEGFKKLDLDSKEIGLGETIFSFGSLLANGKEDNKQLLAGSLTDAYIEKKKDDISSKEEIDMLKHNLFLLFENADNLKKTFKALRLFTQSAFKIGRASCRERV